MQRARETPLTGMQILGVLRQHRDELRERFGVKSIALFGSYAKNSQHAESDLDFVAEFWEPSYDHLIGLTAYLEALFERPVEILTPAGIDSIRVPEVADDIRRTLLHV